MKFVQIITTLVIFILIFKYIAFEKIFYTIKNINLNYIFFSIILNIIIHLLSSFRMYMIVVIYNRITPFKKLLKFQFIANFFNMTLPTGLGGDLFKVFLVKKYTGMIRSVRICFLDRFIGFLTIWFFWTIFFGFYYSFFYNKTFFLMILFFNLATWSIFFITIKFNKNLYFRFKFINWLILIVKDFIRIKKFKHSFVQICIAICIYFVAVLSLIMVGKSININISIFDYLLFSPLILLAPLIPISIGGWGTRESITVLILSYLNISIEQSFSLSLLFGLTILISSIPAIFMSRI